ncbi:MAG: AMP-binding protein [Bacteroidales bacterium]
MIRERFITYVEESIRKNWEIEALSNYREKGYTYKQIAELMVKQHIAFREYGIQEGDKVALLGRNSANWCAMYLAVVTYGAVIVPILPDFKPDDLHNIINHSDSKMLFVDEKIWELLDPEKMKEVRCVRSLDSFEMIMSRSAEITEIYKNLDERFRKAFPEFGPSDIRFSGVDNEQLAVISYTSGTTGFSKGVMIPHRSLAANIRYAQNNMPLEPGDPVVSFLPLAHTYGCAFEFLFPFTLGCHISILTKTPSPQILLQAFKEIRPKLIISVPLVIEKVYQKQILTAITKPAMKVLLKVPGINKVLFNKIREKLETSFGGRFKELVIGGAAFNADAEKFFKKIGLRFSIGYGMTECGPLISYDGWKTARITSCGKAVDTLEVKIDSPDQEKIVGEIILRGDNMMLGYYKNDKATKDVIDENGWMHTGDLGVIDRDGYIYIKGRSKDMLLGPSGKNIYPEEIESLINNYKYVNEAVVISEDDKLVGLVYPDYDTLRAAGIGEDGLAAALDEIRKDVNRRLPDYMAVTRFRVHPEEFAKTPKKSIKRYLYMKQ